MKSEHKIVGVCEIQRYIFKEPEGLQGRLQKGRGGFFPCFMLPVGHISRSPVASTVAKWTTNLTHVRAEMLATSWSS